MKVSRVDVIKFAIRERQNFTEELVKDVIHHVKFMVAPKRGKWSLIAEAFFAVQN